MKKCTRIQTSEPKRAAFSLWAEKGDKATTAGVGAAGRWGSGSAPGFAGGHGGSALLEVKADEGAQPRAARATRGAWAQMGCPWMRSLSGGSREDRKSELGCPQCTAPSYRWGHSTHRAPQAYAGSARRVSTGSLRDPWPRGTGGGHGVGVGGRAAPPLPPPGPPAEAGRIASGGPLFRVCRALPLLPGVVSFPSSMMPVWTPKGDSSPQASAPPLPRPQASRGSWTRIPRVRAKSVLFAEACVGWAPSLSCSLSCPRPSAK